MFLICVGVYVEVRGPVLNNVLLKQDGNDLLSQPSDRHFSKILLL